MINIFTIPYSAYRILSDDTGLNIDKSYNFKVLINDIESIETITVLGYSKLCYYNLLQILNRKLSHYGIHVKLTDAGITFDIDGKSIKIIDIDLFGALE